MAIKIPKDRESWIAARKTGLGASEAGTIIGVNKWKSNVQLWQEKVGLREPEDISGKSYVQYGHDAEPHLRALFALDHPELRMTYESPYKMIFSDELPFIYATPDGELEEIATGRLGGFECKTTEIMNPQQWKLWDGRIPDTYFAQVCHQFKATGWDFIYLLVQIKYTTQEGDKRKMIKEYPIERNEVLDSIEYLTENEIKFWDDVKNKREPALILPSI